MVCGERELRILTPTSQREFNKKFCAIDVETYSNKTKFQTGIIYMEDEEPMFFTDKREMINYLKGNKFKNVWIFTTNIQFDFFKLFEGEIEVKHFQILFPKSAMIYAKTFLINGEFSYYNDGKKGNRSIYILDTMNYAGGSVENMGKIIGLPKLECPFPYGYKCKNKKELESMRIYNLRDAEISCKYMIFLREEFKKLGANLKFTIAGCSMSLFRNRFLKEDILCHKIDVVKEIFKSYYGGRTECFRRGRISKKFYCYDKNSMYPAVMRYKYPHPNYIRIVMTNSIQYIKKYEGFSDVDLWCPEDMKYPLLPFKREDGMLIFATGLVRGYYTHIELRRAIELGYKILKVRKSIYYTKTMYPFKDFVDTLYALRMKFKAEKNPAEHIVKILMNSLYGKFASKFDSSTEMIPIANYTANELNNVLSENADAEVYGDYLRLDFGEGTPALFCIPEWSSYVTAYARIEIHKHIIEAKNPIYVDTDSIFTEYEMETSNELGAMKKEYESDEGTFVRPKFYAIKGTKEFIKIKGLQKKIKIKGLDASLDRIVKLDYTQFKNILKNPKVFYDKFTKWKEGLRKRKKGSDIETGEIVEQFKVFSLEDSKRDWLGKEFKDDKLYDSKPIHINMDGEYSVEFEMPTELWENFTDDETEIKQEYFDI